VGVALGESRHVCWHSQHTHTYAHALPAAGCLSVHLAALLSDCYEAFSFFYSDMCTPVVPGSFPPTPPGSGQAGPAWPLTVIQTVSAELLFNA
jgi:hypothetical protein